MRPKNLMITLFILGLIFVGIGDSILPKPLGIWSKNTRTQINRVIVKAFNPKVKKPSAKRETQVENLEKAVEGRE